MPRLQRDGVELYYEVHGSGPAVLLTHGFTVTCRMWDGQVAVLRDDYTVIVWDIRGHGQSDSPVSQSAYTEEATVEDMAALLDACRVEKAVIGGLSLGGYLSLAFHLRKPERVRALMLFDTGPGFRNTEALQKWNERAERRAHELETQGAAALGSPEGDKRDLLEARKSSHRSFEGLAKASRGILAKTHSRVIETLEDIRVPTLVLAGADDTRFLEATHYMARKIPGAREVLLPGAAHHANAQEPERFNDAMLSFLKSLP